MSRIVHFIESHELRGKGIEGDPIRRVPQYFTFDGMLVFEIDPCLPNVEVQRAASAAPLQRPVGQRQDQP